MDWKLSIVSFFTVVVATCTIPFINIEDDGIKPAQTNVVEQVLNVHTNDIQFTNQVDRGNSNLDWFKDNSNYIWDGWKIK